MDTYTKDLFLGGRITCKQPLHGFRAGTDSVLLAASISAENGTKALEIGCATGVVSMCALYRCPSLHIDGIEIEESYKDYALNNMQNNKFHKRFRFFHADITTKIPILNTMGLNCDFYDQAIINPPYFLHGNNRSNHHPLRDISRKRPPNALSLWISRSVSLLNAKGVLTLIIPTETLTEALIVMQHYQCGAIKILPIHSYRHKSAHRVIIQARKGRKTPPRLLPALYLYNTKGQYYKTSNKILKDGQHIDLK